MIAKLLGSIRTLSRLRKLKHSRCNSSLSGESHLLVIAWTFPPLFATSVHSPFSLARDALSVFDKVTVLCGEEHEDHWPSDAAAPKIPAQIDIIRADTLSIPPLADKIVKPIDGGIDTAIAMTEAAMRALSETPPDTIVASGPRFSNFIAAKLLHGYFHRTPKLFLHYQDEWNAKTPPFIHTSRTDIMWERRAIEAAEGLIFVTQGKLETYQKSAFDTSGKALMVCGLGWEEAGNLDEAPAPKSETVTLSFVGNSGPQSPLDPFLILYSTAAQRFPETFSGVTLQITGRQPPTTNALIVEINLQTPGLIKSFPPVPPAEATRRVKSSNILLLLANTTYSGVIPLKMFDYMATDLPILVFDQVSEAAHIVQKTGAGKIVEPNDCDGLANALKHLRASDTRPWQTKERATWKDCNQRSRLNAKMLEFIVGDTIVSDHPSQMAKSFPAMRQAGSESGTPI